MTDYILPILGHLAYFAFATWLIIATWINFVILPVAAIRHGKQWNASTPVVVTYIIAWAVVLTIPTIPALIGG